MARYAAVAVGALTACALAGCTSSSSGDAAAAPESSSLAVTTAAASPPAPLTASSSSSSAAIAPVASTTSSPADPATVVQAYYDAINASNYAQAWSLGGDNLGESFTQFAAGFADTTSDTLQVLGESGSTVTVDITSTHTDGGVQDFTGTYTVDNTVITGAHITLVSSLTATAGSRSSVHPGAFCDPVGAVSYTSDGTRMVCTSKPPGTEARWRHG